MLSWLTRAIDEEDLRSILVITTLRLLREELNGCGI